MSPIFEVFPLLIVKFQSFLFMFNKFGFGFNSNLFFLCIMLLLLSSLFCLWFDKVSFSSFFSLVVWKLYIRSLFQWLLLLYSNSVKLYFYRACRVNQYPYEAVLHSKSGASEASLPGFRSWLYHLLAA